MPVTAKLSKGFYERFGNEIANELVDWFNSVDATYRADLRELNELNFSRFDAKLEQRVAQLDAKLEQRMAQFDAKLEQRVAQLDAKLEQRVAELRVEVGAVRQDLRDAIGSLRAELLKWSFVFFATAALAVIGLH